MSSETKHLLAKERSEKIDEHEEDDEIGLDNPEPSTATTSGSAVLAKIRRRQSPPFGADYGSSASKYGTLDTGSSTKRSLLVDTYPKTHITKKQFTIAFIAFLIFAGAVAVTLLLGLPRLDAKRAEYYAARFYSSPIGPQLYKQRSVVVTGSPECSRIGQSILTRSNGTAMDAALAALFCSLVTSPQLTRFDSAISGLYFRGNSTTTYSFQSTLASIALPNSNSTLSSPGLIDTARLLHSRFGAIPWATILDPSVQLATSGAPVSRQLQEYLHQHHTSLLKQSPAIQDLFTKNSNGTKVPLAIGDRLRMAGLANTLNSLAVNGSLGVFQNGSIADVLEADLSISGNKTLNLVPTNPLKIAAPLNTGLLNGTLSLLTVPPPSTGVVTSQILAILDRLVISNESSVELCNDDNRTLKEGAFEFHYIIEALKFGYASAQALANGTDPGRLLDPLRVADIVQMILDFSEFPEAEHSPGYYGLWEVMPEPDPRGVATSGVEIAVFDATSGEAVVLSTVNRDELFDGVKVISGSTGIILERGQVKDQVEQIYPTNPLLVLDNASNKVRLAATTTGPESAYAIAQVLYKILYNCQEPKTASDEARFYYSPTSDYVFYEEDFPQAYIDLLTKLFAHYNLKKTRDGASRGTVSTVLRLEAVGRARNATTPGPQGPKWGSSIEGAQLVTMTDYRSGAAFVDGN